MNILHTLYNGKIGGCESHLLNLIEHLNEAEFKSVVVTFSKGVLSEKLKAIGVKCYVLPTRKTMDINVWRSIKSIAKSESIDLINAHGTKACLNSFWASRILNLPLIYTSQNWAFHPHKDILKKSLGLLAERFLVHRAAVNVSVSINNEKIGRKLLNTPNSIIIPNGVDTIKFNHCTRGRITRSELKIPRNRTLFGFVARLCKQKDPLTLLKGFRDALSTDHNLHLLMVGDGQLKHSCLKTIQDLKLEAHVTYIPYVDDVSEVLCLLDVYCLPSKWESLPMGVLEAMAMKKPVIATPVDGVVEVIADNVNGLLVPTGQSDAWKNAILKLHYHPELRKEFANRGRMIVEAHHDIESSAQQMAELYRSFDAHSKYHAKKRLNIPGMSIAE